MTYPKQLHIVCPRTSTAQYVCKYLIHDGVIAPNYKQLLVNTGLVIAWGRVKGLATVFRSLN